MELEGAKKIAQHYEVNHIIADIDSQIFTGSDSTLLQGGGEISKKSYSEIKKDLGTVDTYVPFRNGLMLAQATALAYSLGAKEVWFGAHQDDSAGNAYPDCSLDFYRAMDKAAYIGTGRKISVKAPFIHGNKAQIVATGLKLGVPYELTRSCYEEELLSCGKCATCIDRLKAFEINEATDPIKYN